MRQGQKQAGKKFAAPGETPLGECLVTKTLEQRNEAIFVLHDLPQLRQPPSHRGSLLTYCFAIAIYHD
jgi:hypothetical protein